MNKYCRFYSKKCPKLCSLYRYIVNIRLKTTPQNLNMRNSKYNLLFPTKFTNNCRGLSAMIQPKGLEALYKSQKEESLAPLSSNIIYVNIGPYNSVQ